MAMEERSSTQTKVYIKPFEANGEYRSDFIDVTRYTDAGSVGMVKNSFDSTEYDIGIIKPSDLSLKFSNKQGKFSDVSSLNTIFAYKRMDSIVKVSWDINGDPLIVGSFALGEAVLSEEVTVFEGLLDDTGTKLNVKDQLVNFKCLGYDSLFKRMITPYSTISNGDTVEEVILAICNQSPLKELVTVSASNISVESNITIDDKTSLENKNAKSALDDLLLTGNAVLRIEDGVLHVSPRTPSASLEYTFYGEASNNGIENIENIMNFRNGVHRVFNFITWKDTTLKSQELSSIGKYGYKTKEIDFSPVTNNTNRTTVLTNVKDEFGNPKMEMDLECSFDFDRVALRLLDKVNVDYPIISYAEDGDTLPIFGVAKFGEDKFPLSEYAFNIDPATDFKIVGISRQPTKEKIIFKLREV